MEITIAPMERSHLKEVVEIENESFAIPWSKSAFIRELEENKLAVYVVALWNSKVAGYGGLWHVVTEGHITNIAVKKEFRRKGVGDKLVESLIQIGNEKFMIGLTLEVRVHNAAAISLYKKHGFKPEGIRKEYYADTKEDALIMWKELS